MRVEERMADRACLLVGCMFDLYICIQSLSEVMHTSSEAAI